jgi:hypothetical protein
MAKEPIIGSYHSPKAKANRKTGNKTMKAMKHGKHKGSSAKHAKQSWLGRLFG